MKSYQQSVSIDGRNTMHYTPKAVPPRTSWITYEMVMINRGAFLLNFCNLDNEELHRKHLALVSH